VTEHFGQELPQPWAGFARDGKPCKTRGTYGHLDVEDLQGAMEALPPARRCPRRRRSPPRSAWPRGETFAPHGAPVVRVLVAPRAQLHPIQGGAGRLLTVREVAERLSVSIAMIYTLCERPICAAATSISWA